MKRTFAAVLFSFGLSAFTLNAHVFKDPRLVASDPRITGKMALGYCLPYAMALGGCLSWNAPAFIRKGLRSPLYNPVTHRRLGAHIFVSYLDRQGQQWW